MPEIIRGIFAVLLVALLISTLFFYFFNAKGPWNSFWTFFLVILLCTWIANLWIQPIGFVYYGIGWLTLVSVGLLAALLLTTASRPSRRQKPRVTEQKEAELNPESEKRYQDFNRTAATISGFFWIFMIVMLIVIVLGYAG